VAGSGIATYIVKNNIFAGCTGVYFNYASTSTLISDYNLLFGARPGHEMSYSIGSNENPYSWSQWQAMGYDIHGLNIDPQLDENFRPSAESPVRGAGADLSGIFTTDYADQIRYGRWDIGARQFSQIPIAPVFTLQPLSQVVQPGSTVTLSATASGSPTPTYQWRKNNDDIAGATGASLTLTNVTQDDSGSYTVLADNFGGTTSSAVAVLTVTAPIIITSQPQAVKVVTGASATFTVVASGTPAPTFQWFKDGLALAGATSSSLALANLTPDDAGTYTVTATNSSGSVTSDGATLDVMIPAGFATQPQSQTVDVGASVSFSATATGLPAPTLQWLKNGAPIPGATGTTFTLSHATLADAGAYTVSAINEAGTATSGAILTVKQPTIVIPPPEKDDSTKTPTDTPSEKPANEAPVFTLQPVGQTVGAGATIAFTAAASGTPSPSYQWLRNAVYLPGQNAPTLTLSGVTPANNGTYTVIATNAAGSVTSSAAVLTVNARPAVSTQPLSQTVKVGATVTLKVVATGTPAPTYQWLKNGTPLAGASSANLTLTAITPADQGSYTVIVTNAAGSVTSSTAVLTVTNPAYFTNLSVRAMPGTGADSLIVGFVAAAGSKAVLVRAVGPGMAEFSSLTTFSDPQLTLYSGGSSMASNDNWGGSTELRSTFNRLGAFALSDSSRDAALLATLAPGGYTAIVSGTGKGVALAEIYDADGDPGAGGQLVNISARARVGTGDGVVITGFVIGGDAPMKVLIRAVGPSLAGQGVTGVLIDPQLDLYQGSNRLQHNDNWGGDSTLAAAFKQTGAFALENAGSKDAAILVTLDPGAYTAIVSGVNGTTGNALVEAYEVR
jgi:uncharacterized repeat protein (TIGR01451 family)